MVNVSVGSAISVPVAYGYIGPGVIDVATATRLPVAYGPRKAHTANTYIPPMDAVLYRRNGQLVAVLDESLGRHFNVELNEIGAGSLQLFNDDDVVDLIGDGDIIRFLVDGQAAQAILAQEVKASIVAGGEEADERTTVTGPGHAAVLEEAVVYPARAFHHGPGRAEVGGFNNRTYIGVGLAPIEEDRLFGWMSVDYYDASWWNATVIWPDIPSANIWYEAHDAYAGGGFPDDTATVLWMGGGPDGAPAGDAYLRGWITAPTTGQYTIYTLIDNWGTVYVDGQKILETDGSKAFLEAEETPIELSAGEHLFAVKGTNWGDEAFNPGAVALAVYRVDPLVDPETDEEQETLIGHTTPAWKGATGPPEPGMRVGEIIENLIIEAQCRGALGDVRTGFTYLHDSGGQEWPAIIHSTRTGTDVLTALRELSDTYVDWWMEPASLKLHCWNKGTRGRDVDVALERGVNLLTLDITERYNATTSMLTRWNGGWHDQTTKGVVRREAMLSLGAAQAVDMVTTVALGQLEQADEKLRTVSATITPHPGDDPFVDFLAGDRLIVPDRHDSTTRELVREIVVTEDDDGNLEHQLTLGAIVLEPDEALAQAIKKMTPGTMRGQSKVATPVSVNIPLGKLGSAVATPGFTVFSEADYIGGFTGFSDGYGTGDEEVIYTITSFKVTVPYQNQVDGSTTWFEVWQTGDTVVADINLGTAHAAGTYPGTISQPGVKLGAGWQIHFKGGGQFPGAFRVEVTLVGAGTTTQLAWHPEGV